MEERARVVAFEDGGRVVLLSTVPGEHCGECRACHALGGGRALLAARALPGLVAGETVLVNLSARGRLAAALLLFLVPVLCFLAVLALVGPALGEGPAALAGAGAVLAWLFLIGRIDRRRLAAGRYLAEVVGRLRE